jgi:hypothetical protein
VDLLLRLLVSGFLIGGCMTIFGQKYPRVGFLFRPGTCIMGGSAAGLIAATLLLTF